jgi:hypothetical protein
MGVGGAAMSEPYLTIAEIEAQYPNEWVLIANPKKDRSNRVVGGFVILHAPTRDEYYRLIEEWDDPDVKHTAALYTGPLESEYEFIREEPGSRT